jgi:hypothetical protein
MVKIEIEHASDVAIGLREWLNTTAVKAEAVGRSGGDSSMFRVQAKTIAGIIAALTDDAPTSLDDEARRRARDIFQSGQYWKRELSLYASFNQLFWHGIKYNPAHAHVYGLAALELLKAKRELEEIDG